MQAFLEPFRASRKLRAAAVALLSIIVTALLTREAIDPNTLVNAIVLLASAYMGAVAWEDVSARQAQAKVDVASVQATSPTDDLDTPIIAGGAGRFVRGTREEATPE